MKHLLLTRLVIVVLMMQIFFSSQYLQAFTEARSINAQHSQGINQYHQKNGNKRRIEGNLPQQKESEDYYADYEEDGKLADESFQKSFSSTEKNSFRNKPLTMTTYRKDSEEEIDVPTADTQDTMAFNTQVVNFEDIEDATSDDEPSYMQTENAPHVTEISTSFQTTLQREKTKPSEHSIPAEVNAGNVKSPRTKPETSYTSTVSNEYHSIKAETTPHTTEINTLSEISRTVAPHTYGFQAPEKAIDVNVPKSQRPVLEKDNIISFTDTSEGTNKFNNKSELVGEYHNLSNSKENNSSKTLKMNFDIPDVPDVNFNLKINDKDANNTKVQRSNPATFENITGFDRFKKFKHKGKKFKKRNKLVKHYRSPYKIHYNTMWKKRRLRRLAGNSLAKPESNFKNVLFKHKILRKYHSTDPTHANNSGKDNKPKVTMPNNLRVIKITPQTWRPILNNYKTGYMQNALNANKSLRSKTGELNFEYTNFTATNNILDSTSLTDRKDKNEDRAATTPSNLVRKFLERDSQKFTVIDFNASNLKNDSYTEGGARNAIYVINFPASANSSFQNNTEIIKLLKTSQLLDNVHYIGERDVNRREKRECCSYDLFTLINRNPFTVALAFAFSCVVMAVLLCGMFFGVERSFKYRQPPSYSKEDPPEYEVLKNKEQVTGAQINRDVRSSKRSSMKKRL